MGPSKIFKMKFESQRDWPHINEGDTDGSHLWKSEDKTGDMLFQVLGFCSVFGQKCEKRKFQAGGEFYCDYYLLSFKEQ